MFNQFYIIVSKHKSILSESILSESILSESILSESIIFKAEPNTHLIYKHVLLKKKKKSINMSLHCMWYKLKHFLCVRAFQANKVHFICMFMMYVRGMYSFCFFFSLTHADNWDNDGPLTTLLYYINVCTNISGPRLTYLLLLQFNLSPLSIRYFYGNKIPTTNT